jgi:hypothetical protein
MAAPTSTVQILQKILAESRPCTAFCGRFSYKVDTFIARPHSQQPPTPEKGRKPPFEKFEPTTAYPSSADELGAHS